jgi:hypothetical protein
MPECCMRERVFKKGGAAHAADDLSLLRPDP